MNRVEPFRIEVPERVLDDLRQRVRHTLLPNQVAGVGWDQGTELGYLTGLLDHWSTAYDWRVVEAQLNAIPQYVTQVGEQRFHFLHVRSANPSAVPLLLQHGWPGSVVEFLDVIAPLSADFHLVIPSLPGFTFAGPTSERGWHPRRVAEALVGIMDQLGYDRYGLQGGDWGSLVCTNVADLQPERVIGLHLNMVTAAPVPGAVVTPEEQAGLVAAKERRKSVTGYQAIQSSRPQSLGYALQDSPAGLAAWIVEKFREWSDADLDEAFTVDRLLDNITAYWVTGTAASSLRIYWEMQQAGRGAMATRRIEAPTAVAAFPGELYQPPRAWTEAAYNVVRWSAPPRGGHFAAMEAPAEFVEDVRAFFLGLDNL